MAVDKEYIAELLEANEPARVLAELKKARTKDTQVLFLEGEAHRQLGHFETALKTYAMDWPRQMWQKSAWIFCWP